MHDQLGLKKLIFYKFKNGNFLEVCIKVYSKYQSNIYKLEGNF